MRYMLFILPALIAACMAACSQSVSFNRTTIDEAERVMQTDADSAMAMLDALDPSELKADSLKAKYHYLRAYGHMCQNRSMIGDSLISSAHEYYRGKDVVRGIRSGIALARYRFWVGDAAGAISLLDSLADSQDVPDTLLVRVLRDRALIGVSEYQGEELVAPVRRLIALETTPKAVIEAKYVMLSAYEYSEKLDSALTLTDELIEYSRANGLGELNFELMLERAQILTELGRYAESDADIDYIFQHAGADNGAADYLHMQRAMNALNCGDAARAEHELAISDSFARKIRTDDDVYYHSYSSLLHAMIDFKQTGRIRLAHINSLNNRQRERNNRIKASQWESERSALQQQSRALALKAESEHKTVIILIIAIAAIVTLSGAIMIIRRRRLRERENEERAEALQKMVDELKSAPVSQPVAGQASTALRRAMLQQLGIIKMVAETPTEQNCEMLRKISSIDGDTGGGLVNWDSVFELIDNLYSGFYSRLHGEYGGLLTAREEQIIVLMMAGFSTKEISVITGHTASTIYVRKSSVRKKLGVPEKEDIVAFLREKRFC